jgi:lysophospholipase L1-like esterase
MSVLMISRFSLLILFVFLSVVASQQRAHAQDKPRILAIGDSLMAWHRNESKSIADSLEASLGEPVLNRSISGARIIYGLPVTGALGLRISSQFRDREQYDWVIITGGGNDLMFGCGCARCERRMNRMITAEADKGDVVSLVQHIRKTGARVIYVGYLRSPEMESPIENCKDEGDTFEARLATLAKQDEGVFFHSIAELVPAGDRSFHGLDMIHPSQKASTIIGQQLADLIRRVDRSR